MYQHRVLILFPKLDKRWQLDFSYTWNTQLYQGTISMVPRTAVSNINETCWALFHFDIYKWMRTLFCYRHGM